MKLNKIERLKADLKPIEYLSRLQSLDFANLDESDRFYLKNFGIYTQSQRTDEFMLRVRVAGGRIAIEQLEAIVKIAKEFDAKLILTARAQIELQKLRPDHILKAYNMLESLGLTSWQTLTDNFRNIVTDVYDGIGQNSQIEVYSLILQMQELFLKKAEYVGMAPRKFNTAICGTKSVVTSFFGNDCYFALAIKDGVYGFNLYLGGKNNEVAKSANIFVKQEDVVELFEAVIDAYLKYGFRGSRTKARLFFLIDSVGIKGFVEYIKEFYSKPISGAGELLVSKLDSSDDFYKLANGKYAYMFKSRFGEIDIASLESVIEFAKQNRLELRFGIEQNIYMFGLEHKEVPFKGLSENQNMLVCAGSRYCFFSLFDTKDRVQELELEKINRYGIKVGYSGCLKGCGRHNFSDIGLVAIRTNLYGNVEQGVRLFLGGLYTNGQSGARLIYWAIPLRALNSVINVIIEEFEASGFSDFEEFSKEVLAKFESEFLAFWFLAKLYTKQKASLKEADSFDYLLSGSGALVTEIQEGKDRLYESIKELERVVYS